jgi:hypothetical protein
MTKGEEFVQKVEAVLKARIGSIIGRSILESNLARLKKDAESLTAEDCRALIDNIVKSATIFTTPDELKPVQSDLTNLYKEYS